MPSDFSFNFDIPTVLAEHLQALRMAYSHHRKPVNHESTDFLFVAILFFPSSCAHSPAAWCCSVVISCGIRPKIGPVWLDARLRSRSRHAIDALNIDLQQIRARIQSESHSRPIIPSRIEADWVALLLNMPLFAEVPLYLCRWSNCRAHSFFLFCFFFFLLTSFLFCIRTIDNWINGRTNHLADENRNMSQHKAICISLLPIAKFSYATKYSLGPLNDEPRTNGKQMIRQQMPCNQCAFRNCLQIWPNEQQTKKKKTPFGTKQMCVCERDANDCRNILQLLTLSIVDWYFPLCLLSSFSVFIYHFEFAAGIPLNSSHIIIIDITCRRRRWSVRRATRKVHAPHVVTSKPALIHGR